MTDKPDNQQPVRSGLQPIIKQELLAAVHDFLDDLNSVRKHDAERRGDDARIIERILITQDGHYFEAGIIDDETVSSPCGCDGHDGRTRPEEHPRLHR